MRCLIADLITEVPAAGGLVSRCKDYLTDFAGTPAIIIDESRYRYERYPGKDSELVAYMESAYQFYLNLVNFGGFYLHASTVVVDGKAYLFSGHPTAGKSTHANLWLKLFPGACNINDDKPALRCIDGIWYAYGTPWCGKDGINRNAKAPVAGVCFMKKADHNAIRRLGSFEAMQRIMSQTIYKFPDAARLDRMLANLEKFLAQIPVYELENLPVPEAAYLSYAAMSQQQEDTP